MINRTSLLALIALFFVLSATSLYAQEAFTGFVEFADGERHEMSSGSSSEANALVESLLNSSQDGKCQVFDGEKSVLLIVKTGDQLDVTENDQKSTMTVAEALEAKREAPLRGCKSNLKNIATWLEMWSVDHEDVYPENLGLLTPDYLIVIPPCPVAKTDTYSATYKLFPDPVFFQIQCTGDHSADGMAPGLPAYNAAQGIIEKPEELHKP